MLRTSTSRYSTVSCFPADWKVTSSPCSPLPSRQPKRPWCLGLLAQLVVPHRRAAVRHVVGIFPASGAGAHARLFRPAFRARGGAVSGVVRALRNLPVPDGTDRCRRCVARRLPHPGQFLPAWKPAPEYRLLVALLPAIPLSTQQTALY